MWRARREAEGGAQENPAVREYDVEGAWLSQEPQDLRWDP